MGSEQVLPVFLLAQAVSVIAGAAFAVVLTVPTTQDGTPPALESAQGNADLPAVGAGLDVVETSGFEHNVNCRQRPSLLPPSRRRAPSPPDISTLLRRRLQLDDLAVMTHWSCPSPPGVRLWGAPSFLKVGASGIDAGVS